MGKAKFLKNKAVHFVSDLTTVFLNPISDKPSKPPPPPPPRDQNDSGKNQLESITEENSGNVVDGPDTSSFTAFLYSFMSSSEAGDNSNTDDKNDNNNAAETVNQPSDNVRKESSAKKGLLSRGRQSLRTIYNAARIGGNRGGQERKGDSDTRITDESDDISHGLELKHMKKAKEEADLGDIPATSEPSLLLSEKVRSTLYASLPALVRGRKWLLLYSTWRHGISLSTLYRRSMLWPGPSLLVVGDKKGAVFGGLVDAPLRPNNKRYQGTNNTFVFTNISSCPVVFRPTGANRYFTLCSPDSLAIGGGGHFALYLDGDLLNGSSSVSETYGNPCLAHSEDFQVKEVELWGFVYNSKYEEILASSRREAAGICRW